MKVSPRESVVVGGRVYRAGDELPDKDAVVEIEIDKAVVEVPRKPRKRKGLKHGVSAN